MTNKDFLLWIHGRLLRHGEHPLYDYMHRLRAIARRQEDVERPQADSDYIRSLREIATTQEAANNSLRKQNDQLQEKNDRLRAENEGLRSVLADLIDAIERVQDWDTTHVGDCIDRANLAAP